MAESFPHNLFWDPCLGIPLYIYYSILILPGFMSEVQTQTLNQELVICYHLIYVLDSQSTRQLLGYMTLAKFLNLSVLQFFHL